jgi:hypothetical protein
MRLIKGEEVVPMAEVVQVADLEPIKIRLERGQRGNVGWEITVHGDNAESILDQIKAIDRKLAAEYGKPREFKEDVIKEKEAIFE